MSNAKPIEATIEQIAEFLANGADRNTITVGILDSINQMTLGGIEAELSEDVEEEHEEDEETKEDELLRRFIHSFETIAEVVADEAKTEYEYESFDFHIARAALQIAKSALLSHIEDCSEDRKANYQPGGVHYRGKPNLFIH